MKNRMKFLVGAAGLLFVAQAAAQPLNKCADAAGKITYASQSCEMLGLKPAGGIQERSSVAPALKAPPAAARQNPAPVSSPEASPAAAAAAPASAEPPKGERRCFTVQTSKGKATRCNDAPDETETK